MSAVVLEGPVFKPSTLLEMYSPSSWDLASKFGSRGIRAWCSDWTRVSFNRGTSKRGHTRSGALASARHTGNRRRRWSSYRFTVRGDDTTMAAVHGRLLKSLIVQSVTVRTRILKLTSDRSGSVH